MSDDEELIEAAARYAYDTARHRGARRPWDETSERTRDIYLTAATVWLHAFRTAVGVAHPDPTEALRVSLDFLERGKRVHIAVSLAESGALSFWSEGSEDLEPAS